MKISIYALIAMMSLAAAVRGQLTFANPVSFVNFYGIGDDTIDLDGDGDEDFVFPTMANYFGTLTNAVGTTLNNWPTSIFNGPFIPLTFAPFELVTGDVDSDGQKEIIAVGLNQISVTNIVGTTVSTVYYAHTTGVWTNATVKLTDVNGDGALDVLVIGPTNVGTVVQILNDGAGAFTTSSTIQTPFGIGEAMVAGDFDADGDIDFATFSTAPTSPTMTVLMQTAPGVAEVSQQFPSGTLTTQQQLREAVVADFDGDGNLDFVFSSAGSTVQLTYMRNLGAGIFREWSVVTPLNTPNPIAFGLAVQDLDGDGRDEIAISVGTFLVNATQIFIYRWNTNGTISGQSLSMAGITNISFVPLDGAPGHDLMTTEVIQSMYPTQIIGYSINVFASTTPQSVPPIEVLSVVDGTLADAQFGRSYDRPLRVRVRDRDGMGLAGRSVVVTPSSGIANPANLVTDADGYAATTLTAGSVGDEVAVAFSTPAAAPTSTYVFEIGLESTVTVLGANTTIALNYSFPRSGIPLVLAVDVPMPSPGFLTTPYGDLYTSILSPAPTAFVLDGLGIFGAPNPTMLTSPDWSISATVPTAAITGLTFVAQIYGYDFTRPFPSAILVSNPVFF